VNNPVVSENSIATEGAEVQAVAATPGSRFRTVNLRLAPAGSSDRRDESRTRHKPPLAISTGNSSCPDWTGFPGE
jgi:hypothetical protein